MRQHFDKRAARDALPCHRAMIAFRKDADAMMRQECASRSLCAMMAAARREPPPSHAHARLMFMHARRDRRACASACARAQAGRYCGRLSLQVHDASARCDSERAPQRGFARADTLRRGAQRACSLFFCSFFFFFLPIRAQAAARR